MGASDPCRHFEGRDSAQDTGSIPPSLIYDAHLRQRRKSPYYNEYNSLNTASYVFVVNILKKHFSAVFYGVCENVLQALIEF